MLPSKPNSILLCAITVIFGARGEAAGPDIVVSQLFGMQQARRVGPIGSGKVGLAIGTTSCNRGTAPAHWFALPSVDHPMIANHLYRLKPVEGSLRFEQIGYSWLKHGFFAEQDDGCGAACVPHPDGTQLGVGCSDSYFSGYFTDPCGVGPRSMIHPYTGVMPSGSSLGSGGGCMNNYPSSNHNGHTHDSISHVLQVNDVDLAKGANYNSEYFAEGQYLSPHEFAAGNGNQHNNVSFQEVAVTGPNPSGTHTFTLTGAYFEAQPALDAWVGASQSLIEPTPLVDGRAFLAYQPTDLGDGLWHYEYVLYNMNLDRGISSLSLPVAPGVTISNIGFHAPPHHTPEVNGDAFDSTPWAAVVSGGAITWSTTPFAMDPNANAVRFGMLFNFRFDANSAPQNVSATVGFFKTASSAMASITGPGAPTPGDCDGNGIQDVCDLSCAFSGCSVPNCGNGVDCTGNGILDVCETDCDDNGQADRCEIDAGSGSDCNENNLMDRCEIGGLNDCNVNMLPDFCDLILGASTDNNQNGVPDECDSAGGTIYVDDGFCPGAGSAISPYCRIQDAIDASQTGDTIVVADGLYRGARNRNLNFGGRLITLRSANGPENCTIDAQVADHVLVFDHQETADAVLDGFSIVNGIQQLNPVLKAGHIHVDDSSPVIRNCRFSSDILIQLRAAIGATASSAIIERCGFQGLMVGTGGGSSVRFLRCRFDDVLPTAISCGGIGSTIVVNGCTFVRGSAALTVSNGCDDAVFSNNIVHNIQTGGGNNSIRAIDSSVSVRNSTFIGANSELAAITAGTFFSGPGSVVTVDNSIFWNYPSAVAIMDSFSAVVISNSNTSTPWTGPGFGNISVDPLFVGSATNDYHLSPASPCINAGDPAYVPEDGEVDVDGETRIHAGLLDLGGDEFTDCNSNGSPDYLDVAGLTSADCDENGKPDECADTTADCNGNQIWDACDLKSGVSGDCNFNDVPDECDASQLNADCDEDNIPDACSTNCNRNSRFDVCDIFLGFSPDPAGDGVPDDCQLQGPLPPVAPDNVKTNRYVTFKPNNGTLPVAFRITKLTAPTGVCWAGAPGPNGHSSCVSAPVVRVWSEPLVRVAGCQIVPVASYEVSATTDGLLMAGAVTIDTIDLPSLNNKFWGDLVAANNGDTWFGPNGFTNVNDVLGILAYINNASPRPTFQQANLEAVSSADPCVNAFVNTADLFICVRAASGDPYPFTTNPANCPVCP